MGYHLLLDAFREELQALMIERGVEQQTAEGWSIYFNQLTFLASAGSPADRQRIGRLMASSVRTALWYSDQAVRK